MKMSATDAILCRLCVNTCEDYKLLRDKNGCATKVYKIAEKYFDPMILTKKQADSVTAMCSVCWNNVFEFYNFQQSVMEAQKQLLEGNVEQCEIVIKSEDAITPTTNSWKNVSAEIAIIKEEPEDNDVIIPDNNFPYDNHNVTSSSKTFTGITTYEPNDITDISSSDLDDTYFFENDEDKSINEGNVFITQDNRSTKLPKIKPTEVQKLKELDKVIAEHYPNLECVICSESCSSYSVLQQHFRLRHPKEKCHIFCCERRLGSRFQIEEHVHLHSDPNAFQCTICFKAFNGRYTLYSHVYAQHRKTTSSEEQQVEESQEEKASSRKRRSMELDALIAQWKPTLECLVCTQPFPNFSLLRQHYRQHHPNEECYLYCCGRKFNDRSKLGEHVRFHADPNIYKCELCDAQHKCKRGLYFHIRTYHPQSRDGLAPDAVEIRKPPRKKRCITITSREIDNSIAQYRPQLDCDVCSESCPTFTLLKTHFRLQHPSIGFFIQCCQRKFNNRSEFENHLRLHVNPQAFECELCGKCLSSVKKLRAHKNRMHFTRMHRVNGDDENMVEDVDID